MGKTSGDWDWVITRKTSWLGASLKELYSFRDLLFRLVRKEFLMYYQQTLLGPAWMVLHPLILCLTYVLIFDKVIGLSTLGVPSFLFYLTGLTLWSLFSDIFTGTASTFSQNAHVFSKVYFPRVIAPVAIVLLHGLRFSIQLVMLFGVMAYYYFVEGIPMNGNWLLAIPAILFTAGIAFGAGLIFSVLTAMFRDLSNLQQLMLRMLMFLCPIFYALPMVPENTKWIVLANPLSSLFETFRYALLGAGQVSISGLLYSLAFTIIISAIGILFFNRKGDKLMDII